MAVIKSKSKRRKKKFKLNVEPSQSLSPRYIAVVVGSAAVAAVATLRMLHMWFYWKDEFDYTLDGFYFSLVRAWIIAMPEATPLVCTTNHTRLCASYMIHTVRGVVECRREYVIEVDNWSDFERQVNCIQFMNRFHSLFGRSTLCVRFSLFKWLWAGTEVKFNLWIISHIKLSAFCF